LSGVDAVWVHDPGMLTLADVWDARLDGAVTAIQTTAQAASGIAALHSPALPRLPLPLARPVFMSTRLAAAMAAHPEIVTPAPPEGASSGVGVGGGSAEAGGSSGRIRRRNSGGEDGSAGRMLRPAAAVDAAAAAPLHAGTAAADVASGEGEAGGVLETMLHAAGAAAAGVARSQLSMAAAGPGGRVHSGNGAGAAGEHSTLTRQGRGLADGEGPVLLEADAAVIFQHMMSHAAGSSPPALIGQCCPRS
jgi:hypothetical protein